MRHFHANAIFAYGSLSTFYRYDSLFGLFFCVFIDFKRLVFSLTVVDTIIEAIFFRMIVDLHLLDINKAICAKKSSVNLLRIS